MCECTDWIVPLADAVLLMDEEGAAVFGDVSLIGLGQELGLECLGDFAEWCGEFLTGIIKEDELG